MSGNNESSSGEQQGHYIRRPSIRTQRKSSSIPQHSDNTLRNVKHPEVTRRLTNINLPLTNHQSLSNQPSSFNNVDLLNYYYWYYVQLNQSNVYRSSIVQQQQQQQQQQHRHQQHENLKNQINLFQQYQQQQQQQKQQQYNKQHHKQQQQHKQKSLLQPEVEESQTISKRRQSTIDNSRLSKKTNIGNTSNVDTLEELRALNPFCDLSFLPKSSISTNNFQSSTINDGLESNTSSAIGHNLRNVVANAVRSRFNVTNKQTSADVEVPRKSKFKQLASKHIIQSKPFKEKTDLFSLTKVLTKKNESSGRHQHEKDICLEKKETNFSSSCLKSTSLTNLKRKSINLLSAPFSAVSSKRQPISSSLFALAFHKQSEDNLFLKNNDTLKFGRSLSSGHLRQNFCDQPNNSEFTRKLFDSTLLRTSNSQVERGVDTNLGVTRLGNVMRKARLKYLKKTNSNSKNSSVEKQFQIEERSRNVPLIRITSVGRNSFDQTSHNEKIHENEENRRRRISTARCDSDDTESLLNISDKDNLSNDFTSKEKIIKKNSFEARNIFKKSIRNALTAKAFARRISNDSIITNSSLSASSVTRVTRNSQSTNFRNSNNVNEQFSQLLLNEPEENKKDDIMKEADDLEQKYDDPSLLKVPYNGNEHRNSRKLSLLGRPLTTKTEKKFLGLSFKNTNRSMDYRTYQSEVYNFLERPNSFRAIFYHIFVFTTVFFCLLMSVLATVPQYESQASKVLMISEALVMFWLTIELALRIWSAGCRSRYQTIWGRLRFIRNPFCLLDILVICASCITIGLHVDEFNQVYEHRKNTNQSIDTVNETMSPLRLLRSIAINNSMNTTPSVIPATTSMSITTGKVFAASALRGLRFFQILRMLRMDRKGGTWKLLASVVWAHRQELMTNVYIGFLCLIFSSFLMYLVEKDLNPRINSYADALWWGIVTLCTVGYGDVVPVTWFGKVIAALSALFGISFYALPAGILGSGFALKVQQQQRQKHLIRRRIPAAALIQSLWRCYAADKNSKSLATWKIHVKKMEDETQFDPYTTMNSNNPCDGAYPFNDGVVYNGLPFFPFQTTTANATPVSNNDGKAAGNAASVLMNKISSTASTRFKSFANDITSTLLTNQQKNGKFSGETETKFCDSYANFSKESSLVSLGDGYRKSGTSTNDFFSSINRPYPKKKKTRIPSPYDRNKSLKFKNITTTMKKGFRHSEKLPLSDSFIGREEIPDEKKRNNVPENISKTNSTDSNKNDNLIENSSYTKMKQNISPKIRSRKLNKRMTIASFASKKLKNVQIRRRLSETDLFRSFPLKEPSDECDSNILQSIQSSTNHQPSINNMSKPLARLGIDLALTPILRGARSDDVDSKHITSMLTYSPNIATSIFNNPNSFANPSTSIGPTLFALNETHKTAIRAIRKIKYFVARRKFREALKPYDVKDVIEQYSSGHLDMLSRVKILQNRLDAILGKEKVKETLKDHTSLATRIIRIEDKLQNIDMVIDEFKVNSQQDQNMLLQSIESIKDLLKNQSGQTNPSSSKHNHNINNNNNDNSSTGQQQQQQQTFPFLFQQQQQSHSHLFNPLDQQQQQIFHRHHHPLHPIQQQQQQQQSQQISNDQLPPLTPHFLQFLQYMQQNQHDNKPLPKTSLSDSSPLLRKQLDPTSSGDQMNRRKSSNPAPYRRSPTFDK
ncbi:hypothetical protein SNEBB_006789 [Seison nebaliae]|nr:hypothetical protein SNEBB_006789 [Seison nebaliae]